MPGIRHFNLHQERAAQASQPILELVRTVATPKVTHLKFARRRGSEDGASRGAAVPFQVLALGRGPTIALSLQELQP